MYKTGMFRRFSPKQLISYAHPLFLANFSVIKDICKKYLPTAWLVNVHTYKQKIITFAQAFKPEIAGSSIAAITYQEEKMAQKPLPKG
jgi:hypothetical protein